MVLAVMDKHIHYLVVHTMVTAVPMAVIILMALVDMMNIMMVTTMTLFQNQVQNQVEAQDQEVEETRIEVDGMMIVEEREEAEEKEEATIMVPNPVQNPDLVLDVVIIKIITMEEKTKEEEDGIMAEEMDITLEV